MRKIAIDYEQEGCLRAIFEERGWTSPTAEDYELFFNIIGDLGEVVMDSRTMDFTEDDFKDLIKAYCIQYLEDDNKDEAYGRAKLVIEEGINCLRLAIEGIEDTDA